MSTTLQLTFDRLRRLGRSRLSGAAASGANHEEPEARPYAPLAQILDAFAGPGPHAEILYFGDSVVERVAREDTDKRTLGELFAARVRGQRRALVVTHSAYQAEMYRLLLASVATMASQPSLVIVPINMRSFSPQWSANPAWQFREERDLLVRFAADPSVDIKLRPRPEPSRAAYEAFDSLPVTYPSTAFDQVGHFRLVINARAETEEQQRFRSRQIFIFHYLHRLTQEHALIHALRGIVATGRRMGARILFYTTPINYQAGSHFVGEEFTTLLAANVSVVRDVLGAAASGDGASFLDYSQWLDSEYFFHSHLATEHLNLAGRQLLANEIAARSLDAF